MRTQFYSIPRGIAYLLFLAGLVLLPTTASAADRIDSAEAALDRFRAACDHEIKQAVSPEIMTRINSQRGLPSLTIVRHKSRDFARLKDPKELRDASRTDLYGSHEAVAQSTGDTWVLHYEYMKGLEAYIDAATGAVLCVAFIPEG